MRSSVLEGRRILIVNPSPAPYLLQSLSECGAIPVVATHRARWRGSNLPFETIIANVFEDAELSSRVRAFHEKSPLSVVLPTWEGTSVQTAMMARLLGLDGESVEAVCMSRNKALLAERLTTADVRAPRSVRLFEEDDGIDCLRDVIGYPAILKLPSSTNSHSVTRINNESQYRSAYGRIRRMYTDDPGSAGRLLPLFRHESVERPILLQEYVDGPELNIDILYYGTSYTVLGIFEKAPMNGPYFGELYSVHPTSLSGRHVEECVSEAVKVLRALGAKVGIAHIELRYSRQGPTVIDVGLRPGGAYTPQAIEILRGINVFRLLAETLAGQEVTSLPPPCCAALYGGVLIEEAGVVERLEGLDVLLGTSGLIDYRVFINAGDVVKPLPESSDYHIVHFLLRGVTRESLIEAAERIRFSIKCIVRRAP